jgi:hypothetical protein
LMGSVIARPNMLYIVYFLFYCSHDFILGYASSFLSLKPQNTYMSATDSTHKALALTLVSDVGYYNPTTSRRIVSGSDIKCNSSAQHAIYCPLWILLPSWFCSWWREPTFATDTSKHVQHVNNRLYS